MAETLNQMFQESLTKHSDRVALCGKVRQKRQTLSYRELGQRVRMLVNGLVGLGVKRGDRIALLSENRIEWAIIDLAILHIGAINVAIFPMLPAGQVRYIVADSESKIIFVSDKEQLAKALQIKKTLPDLRIITFDCSADPSNDVTTFEDLMHQEEVSRLSDADYEQLWKSVQPHDWATIIYTSGTTGDPKGAILSHANFASNVDIAKGILTFQPGQISLSFVTLSHAMGRLGDLYIPLRCGSTVAFVENLRRLRQNLEKVKPHYMILVPRVLDMFREGLLATVTKESPRKQKLFYWALSVAKCQRERTQRQRVKLLLPAFKAWLADRFVFANIRKRLGLNRLRFFFCGSAPLSRQTGEFLAAMGLKVMEGYGLTETSCLATINLPGRIKFGTVGLPIKGVEVRIKADGEVLIRGPNIMQGYYKKPVETAEALDDEGWLHTGDIGQFDEEGVLKITDRKKNLLVLNNGKKVAPQPIENKLLESPYLSQIVLLGDQQDVVTALIVPNFKRVREWAKEHSIRAASEDNHELVKNQNVTLLIRKEIQRLSNDLADFEKIRHFSLIDHEFSLENEEVTPTFKIRRRAIMEKYHDLIEAMYHPSNSEASPQPGCRVPSTVGHPSARTAGATV